MSTTVSKKSENHELDSCKSSKLFKHPRIAHNGFLYHFHKKCKRHLRWKCNRVFAMKCPCVMRTSTDIGDLRIIAIDHEHVHPNDTTSITIMKLKLSSLEEGNNEQTTLIELTENDLLKTTIEKRTYESENIIKNKKFKYSASNQGFIIIPPKDKIVGISHVNSNASDVNNENNKVKPTENNTSRSKYENIKTYSKIHKKTYLPKIDDTINTQNGPFFTQIDENTLKINNPSINDLELTFGNDKKEIDSENVFNNSDDDFEAKLFTKQNWSDTLDQLNNPSIGLKLFESILLQKMIDHIMYSSAIAENQFELDNYKIRENYWKSKFQSLSGKLKIIKKDLANIKPLIMKKHISVQTDIEENQAEELSNEINKTYQPCEEETLNNQKHLKLLETDSTNLPKNNIIEFSNSSNSIIDLNKNIPSSMEISEIIPKSAISQNGKSIIQNFIFTSDIAISTNKYFIEDNIQNVAEYNMQSASGYLIETQVLINPDNEFTKTVFNHTNSSFDTYKLFNSNEMSLQNSTTSIVLTNSHDITYRNNIDEERFVLSSSINPAQIKNDLPDICQNIEQVKTIDLTTDSDSDVDIRESLKLKPVPLSLPIVPDIIVHSNELMPVNIIETNINNTLPRPQLEVKLNDSEDNSILSVFLSWTHNQVNGITSYELYCYTAFGDDSINNPWKLIGELSALPVPMTVNLKLENIKGEEMYYFSVRAKDKIGRHGPFSTPISTQAT